MAFSATQLTVLYTLGTQPGVGVDAALNRRRDVDSALFPRFVPTEYMFIFVYDVLYRLRCYPRVILFSLNKFVQNQSMKE